MRYMEMLASTFVTLSAPSRWWWGSFPSNPSARRSREIRGADWAHLAL